MMNLQENKSKYTDEILEKLSELVEIPSVSHDRKQVKRALDYVLELGKALGFETGAFSHGRVGVIEWGRGPETLGILAHVDVVPPDPVEEWETDPFKAVVRNGRIYGRGTMDDKGMVITSLYAMKAAADFARQNGVQPRKKVQLIIGTQEEAEWDDMYEYVASNPLPDYGFTPDGEFPFANIEKGIVDAEMVFELQENRRVVSLEAGSAVNAVPAFAKAVFSDGTSVTATGKTCHSCDPSKGDNAVFNILDELRRRQADGELIRILEMLQTAFGDIYGKNLPIYKEDEYYDGEWVHRNVFSPTLVKTRGSRLIVTVDVRFAYGTEDEEIVRCIGELASSCGGRLENVSVMPAVFVPRSRPFLKVFSDVYDKYSGAAYSGSIAMGGSYAKTMPNIVSWGPIFPGDEDGCHEPNESIGIDSIEKCFLIYSEAIQRILFSDRSFK